MKLKWRAIGIAICSSVLLVLVSPVGNPTDGPPGKNESSGFVLAKPVFAQSAEASFLEKEAGIAAYVNVGRALDLGRAKTAYRTVERETQNYIVGSVALRLYGTVDDVHLYVQRDGWLVAYYMKGGFTSGIVDWLNYSPGKMDTTLKLGLDRMATALGLAITSVKYYHFGYPWANRLTVIAGGYFTYTIPAEFVVYEGSGSSLTKESTGYANPGVWGWGENVPQMMNKDVKHSVRVSIEGPWSGQNGGYPRAVFWFDGKDTMHFKGQTANASYAQALAAIVIVYQG